MISAGFVELHHYYRPPGLPPERQPWLAKLRQVLVDCVARNENAVLACSALKEAYRDVLIDDPGRVKLIYLNGTPELLASRLGARTDHFAPPALLTSQLATLEEPRHAFTVDVATTPDALATQIRRHYSL